MFISPALLDLTSLTVASNGSLRPVDEECGGTLHKPTLGVVIGRTNKLQEL